MPHDLRLLSEAPDNRLPTSEYHTATTESWRLHVFPWNVPCIHPSTTLVNDVTYKFLKFAQISIGGRRKYLTWRMLFWWNFGYYLGTFTLCVRVFLFFSRKSPLRVLSLFPFLPPFYPLSPFWIWSISRLSGVSGSNPTTSFSSSSSKSSFPFSRVDSSHTKFISPTRDSPLSSYLSILFHLSFYSHRSSILYIVSIISKNIP